MKWSDNLHKQQCNPLVAVNASAAIVAVATSDTAVTNQTAVVAAVDSDAIVRQVEVRLAVVEVVSEETKVAAMAKAEVVLSVADFVAKVARVLRDLEILKVVETRLSRLEYSDVKKAQARLAEALDVMKVQVLRVARVVGTVLALVEAQVDHRVRAALAVVADLAAVQKENSRADLEILALNNLVQIF